MAQRIPEVHPGLGGWDSSSPCPAAALASRAGRQGIPFPGFCFGFVGAQNSSCSALGLLWV